MASSEQVTSPALNRITRDFTPEELVMLRETGNFVPTKQDTDPAFLVAYPMVFVACKKPETARRMFFRDVIGQAIRIGTVSPKLPFKDDNVEESQLALELEQRFQEASICSNNVIRIITNYSQPILYLGSFMVHYWARKQGVEMPIVRPGQYWFNISATPQEGKEEHIVASLILQNVQVLNSETTDLVEEFSSLEFQFKAQFLVKNPNDDQLNPEHGYDDCRDTERYGAWGLHKTFSYTKPEDLQGAAATTHAAVCRV